MKGGTHADDSSRRLTRRELLKRAGTGAAAIGVAGAGAPFAFAGPHKYTGRWLSGNLGSSSGCISSPPTTRGSTTLGQAWGEKNDVQVTSTTSTTRCSTAAAAEVAAQSGHDLFFILRRAAIRGPGDQPRADRRRRREEGREDRRPREAVDVQPEDEEVLRPLGQLRPRPGGLATRPLERRRRVAGDLGPRAEGGAEAEGDGHPIGIGMSNELDSNMANIAFLMCFGSFIQNEENHRRSSRSRRSTRSSSWRHLQDRRDDEIFGWNPASNNNFLYSGKGSMILNAISATRTPEDQELPFADDLWIWPIPAGPHGRLGLEHVMGCYSSGSSRRTRRLRRSSLPICASTTRKRRPRASSTTSRASRAPSRSADQEGREDGYAQAEGQVHDPDDDRGEVHAQRRLSGLSNAAINEIFTTYLIPQMFAQVAQGKMSAEDSVRHTNTPRSRTSTPSGASAGCSDHW